MDAAVDDLIFGQHILDLLQLVQVFEPDGEMLQPDNRGVEFFIKRFGVLFCIKINKAGPTV